MNTFSKILLSGVVALGSMGAITTASAHGHWHGGGWHGGGFHHRSSVIIYPSPVYAYNPYYYPSYNYSYPYYPYYSYPYTSVIIRGGGGHHHHHHHR